MTRWLGILLLVPALAAPGAAQGGGEGPRGPGPDARGNLPEKVRRLQSRAKVEPPTLEHAIAAARAAARRVARPLIDAAFHQGRRLGVPDGFATIQAALDAARPGDVVVVRPGTYFELLRMKDGVKLVSDSAEGGDEPVPVPGARLKLPRRTLRTILDGSKSQPSHHGMIDFDPGLGRRTIVDGFTIRNLPEQDHHVPGHAHGLNVRGASPVILNCYIHGNGSTGIGNHVVYRDQGRPLAERDFRQANVAHEASAVIFNNVLSHNLGLGIGCNHLSSPVVAGNEIFANSDAALGGPPAPGLGAKHGAQPRIVGNLVHGNPGGGILAKIGAAQGAHPIDRRTCPAVEHNVVLKNGDRRPGISCSGGGTAEKPVTFRGNVVFDSGAVGIGLSDGAVGVVEDNLVCRSRAPGIAVFGATALRLDRNRVAQARGPGFVFSGGARILRMVGNAADANAGPPFLVANATVAAPDDAPSR